MDEIEPYLNDPSRDAWFGSLATLLVIIMVVGIAIIA